LVKVKFLSKAYYQTIVNENLKILRELNELETASRAVMLQLGLEDKGSGLRAALLLQWLIRLYSHRVGESCLIREIRRLLSEEN